MFFLVVSFNNHSYVLIVRSHKTTNLLLHETAPKRNDASQNLPAPRWLLSDTKGNRILLCVGAQPERKLQEIQATSGKQISRLLAEAIFINRNDIPFVWPITRIAGSQKYSRFIGCSLFASKSFTSIIPEPSRLLPESTPAFKQRPLCRELCSNCNKL